ncbi:unnamed protein product [Cladocopium goreaui]|uniref:Dynactin subunit 5 n=1 Tax=Cladocopium goreaui TaxID=2562237 RepID=A0A9P1DHG0_9DINO|nr:unnamed protein product [Cladocopium goreaui]
MALELEAPPIYYNKVGSGVFGFENCSALYIVIPWLMELADYIQTASGNKALMGAWMSSEAAMRFKIGDTQVSRNSVLCGSQNITLVGNSVIMYGCPAGSKGRSAP